MVEHHQPVPIGIPPGEQRAEIVLQVAAGMGELAQKAGMAILVKGGAQQEVPGLERDHPDRHIGQRVAEKRGAERGQDIAADRPRDQEGDDEVHPVERSKGGEHPGPDTPRDPLGRVGQAAHPVLDVQKGTVPAAAGIEKFGNGFQERAAIPAFEYQRRRPFVPEPISADRRVGRRWPFTIAFHRGHVALGLEHQHE